MFTLSDAKKSLRVLGLPINRENIRKCARAKYLFDNKFIRPIEKMSDENVKSYHCLSQWEAGKIYTISLNGLSHSCDCPDSAKSEICKHRIAAMMFEFKQSNAHKRHKELVTFTVDKISSLECRSISIWNKGRFYTVNANDCQIEGLMVTMPKGIADRLGIDYRFDPDRPEYSDSPKFDYAIFRHETDSYKLEQAQRLTR